MNPSPEKAGCVSTSALPLDPVADCDACGSAGAFRFDGATLCPDCYAERGSSCSPGDSDQARTAGTGRFATGV